MGKFGFQGLTGKRCFRMYVTGARPGSVGMVLVGEFLGNSPDKAGARQMLGL